MGALFKNNLKYLKNVIVIFIGILLLNYLIGIMSYSDDLSINLFYVIILAFSLVIPAINLRYLFDQIKQTQFNSLPFTRIQSFAIHYLSGLIVIVIPAMFYCFMMKLNYLNLILFILIYYSMANLTAYLTTSLTMNFVLLLAIIFIPIILYFSLLNIYSTYIRGVVIEISITTVSYLFPFIGLVINAEKNLDLNIALIYVIYFLIILILAIYVCKFRKLENNYAGFSYKIVSNTIVVLIIVCISWLILTFLGKNSWNFEDFTILNIIIIAIVVFTVQFIRFHKIKYGLCIIQTTVITLTTVAIFVTSANYIENYIPTSIEKATIGVGTNKNNIFVNDQESINEIVAIHKQLLESSDGEYNIDLTYKNKNGTTVRNYQVEKEVFDEIITQIDDNIFKCWFSNSYELIKIFDQDGRISFKGHEINDDKDKKLLKSILENKLRNFKNHKELISQINYFETNEVISVYHDGKEMYFSSYLNDPIYQMIEEFDKIKAN